MASLKTEVYYRALWLEAMTASQVSKVPMLSRCLPIRCRFWNASAMLMAGIRHKKMDVVLLDPAWNTDKNGIMIFACSLAWKDPKGKIDDVVINVELDEFPLPADSRSSGYQLLKETVALYPRWREHQAQIINRALSYLLGRITAEQCMTAMDEDKEQSDAI